MSLFSPTVSFPEKKLGWHLKKAAEPFNIIVLVCFVLGISWSSQAQSLSHEDPRLAKIDVVTLKRLISETPLESPKHQQLIQRAAASSLAGEAYDQYTSLWKENKDSFELNLYRGVSAQEYWAYATHPTVNKLPLGSKEAQKVLVTARYSLLTATKLSPKSMSARRAYGYFLYRYGSSTQEGVKILRDVRTFLPKDATIRAMMGDVYSSPNEFYNYKAAESELLAAIRLDSAYATPHFLLARLYSMNGLNQKARAEAQKFISLAPHMSKIVVQFLK